MLGASATPGRERGSERKRQKERERERDGGYHTENPQRIASLVQQLPSDPSQKREREGESKTESNREREREDSRGPPLDHGRVVHFRWSTWQRERWRLPH